jgi:hypothetical protein
MLARERGSSLANEAAMRLQSLPKPAPVTPLTPLPTLSAASNPPVVAPIVLTNQP